MSKKNKNLFQVGDVYDPEIAALDEKSRMNTLESVSYSVNHESYTKNLEDSDLTNLKSELAEVSIKLNELDLKKKAITEEIKAEMKIPKMEKMQLLESIKHKSEYREGMIYKIDDQDAGLMFLFDTDAICIDLRPLTKEEKQTVLKMTKATGTDGK